jgi:uncharacterized membrane-anchored protein
MFSAVYLFLAAPIIVWLLNCLVAVRVGRVNLIEGLCVFFLWPVGGIWSMIAHRRDPGVKIRVPMLLALVISGVWLSVYISGLRGEREYLAAYNARHQAAGAESTLAKQLRLSVAVANLPFRAGAVDVASAHARIDVTAHFRFVDRAALESLYRQFDDELDASTVGWLVHESVNLADEEAWFVVVDWYRDGFVAEADFASLPTGTLLADAQRTTQALSDDEDYRLVGYAEEPELDASRHLATWVEETAEGGAAHRLDCYAAKLGRRGAVQFTIEDVATSRRELCLRSVRLAAARTTFADGENYADHSRLFDRKARYNLAGFVTGTALLPK